MVTDFDGANYVRKLFLGLERNAKIWNVIFYSEDKKVFEQLQHLETEINETVFKEYKDHPDGI